jgi:hypothetical protein
MFLACVGLLEFAISELMTSQSIWWRNSSGRDWKVGGAEGAVEKLFRVEGGTQFSMPGRHFAEKLELSVAISPSHGDTHFQI